MEYLACQDPEKVKAVFLVHGEYEVQKSFRKRLIKRAFKNVFIPNLGESFDAESYF